MLKKIYTLCFICAFLAVLALPLVLVDLSGGTVSQEENRFLADFPRLTVDGVYNEGFTSECESWFRDHMGLRNALTQLNGKLQYSVFGRLPGKTNFLLGPNGELNYASQAIIDDYARLNLRSDEEVAAIGESLQTISQWTWAQGRQFYYVQCFDKHSVLPEQFPDTVIQPQQISKTDQVIAYLQEHTDAVTIPLKQVMQENENTYSVWGDPTHWTDRGAYLGYRTILETVNIYNDPQIPILSEADYTITREDVGKTFTGIHEEDWQDVYTITDPKAYKGDVAVMGETLAKDNRHSVWYNPDAETDKTLLLVADSYINSYIVEDFAESFSQVWLVWGDFLWYYPNMVENLQPDIVILACAERVDRSASICKLAETLTAMQ